MRSLPAVIEVLDDRSQAAPADFDELELTTLSEVAANGVQTISSVQGKGLELCEQAMTTLLQGYIAERQPIEWKGLFKDATNIAFQVKYMVGRPLRPPGRPKCPSPNASRALALFDACLADLTRSLPRAYPA